MDTATQKPIVLWAHRGDSHSAPENTFDAFRIGREKAFALETDTWLSADGVPVLWHDESLLRCTGNPRKISSYSFEELQGISGAPEGEPYAEIISVERFFGTFRSGKVSIDFKENNKELIEKVVKIVVAYGRLGDVVFGSFHDEALLYLKSLEPKAIRSASPKQAKAILLRHLLHLSWEKVSRQFDMLCIPYELKGWAWLGARFIKEAHRYGVGVHLWTVNDVRTALRLAALGIDGIMTDNPTLLAEALNVAGYTCVDDQLIVCKKARKRDILQ